MIIMKRKAATAQINRDDPLKGSKLERNQAA